MKKSPESTEINVGVNVDGICHTKVVLIISSHVIGGQLLKNPI